MAVISYSFPLYCEINALSKSIGTWQIQVTTGKGNRKTTIQAKKVFYKRLVACFRVFSSSDFHFSTALDGLYFRSSKTF